MKKKDDLISRINNHYDTFSKGHTLLADYIVENYDKAAFLTAVKLGSIVGVSESTVVRFAIELGYDGYPKMQKALEELIKNKLNSVQRMKVTSERLGSEHILNKVLQSDYDIIKNTIEQVDEVSFDNAVKLISNARNIYIIGVRSCEGLASFMGYYMNIIFENVKVIKSNSISDIFEQIYRISSNDIIIGISFPRYSKWTFKAMEFAKKRNAHIIALTDSYQSPISQYAECNLIAKSDMASIVDSLVAPLSIINALIVSLCSENERTVQDNLKTLEQIWDEYEVYDNDKVQ